MTYWAINAIFLAAVDVLVVAAVLVRRGPRWRAVGIAALVLVIMTAVFDNVMIGIGLVDYDPARISGLRLGVAPIEDFAYTIAVVLGLPALWHLLPASRRTTPSRPVPLRASGATTSATLHRSSGDDGRGGES